MKSAPAYCHRKIKNRFQKLFTGTIQIKYFEPLYLTKPNYVHIKKNFTAVMDCYMRLMATYTWGILGRKLLPY
jgi:hypothetical protein